MESTLGIKYDLTLPFADRSSNILRVNFTGMPWSTCNRLVQKKMKKIHTFFVRKGLTISDLLEGLWSVGARFRHYYRASPSVKALVRWATGKRLTNHLPKLKPYNTLPPFEQRDSWSSYGAVRAFSKVLLQSLGTQGV